MILGFGGEMGAVVPNSSGVTESTATNESNFNTSFCRASIECFTTAEYAEWQLLASHNELWAHFDVVGDSVGNQDYKLFSWLNSAGTEVVRLMHDELNNEINLDWWNGSAWTTVGLAPLALDPALGRQTLDLHARVNSASGVLRLYAAGTKIIDSGTVNLTSITNLKNFRMFGVGGAVPQPDYWSQIVVADEPTVGMRVMTVYASGAGNDTAWTGAYTEIDEIVYDDADGINTTSADQVETFAGTLISSIADLPIRAVCVTARARCGVTGPQNLQLALRVSGANYFSSSLALDAGFGAHMAVWESNPATLAAWVPGDLASGTSALFQFGVKSIA